MVETVDLIFAVDSVPAVFAVTQDTFIVYTSNIFAILGLRALYFALAAAMNRFRYLQVSLAIVLVLIGIKVALVPFGVKIDTLLSLLVTIAHPRGRHHLLAVEDPRREGHPGPAASSRGGWSRRAPSPPSFFRLGPDAFRRPACLRGSGTSSSGLRFGEEQPVGPLLGVCSTQTWRSWIGAMSGPGSVVSMVKLRAPSLSSLHRPAMPITGRSLRRKRYLVLGDLVPVNSKKPERMMRQRLLSSKWRLSERKLKTGGALGRGGRPAEAHRG